MSYIPKHVIPIFEAGIYLPMVLTVLHQDLEAIEAGCIKLKQPYILLLNDTLKNVERDLSMCKEQFKKHRMRLKRGTKDRLFTEFHFYFEDVLEVRRYSNIRLRNYTEYMLEQYLMKKPVKYPTLNDS